MSSSDHLNEKALVFDSGSFKDRQGAVGQYGKHILRTLSAECAQMQHAFAEEGKLTPLIEKQLLIPSWLVNTKDLGLDEAVYGKTMMEHEPVLVVNYPYEWAFDMLKDAALLTLELLQESMNANLILKDATAYNVMLHNGRMTFIDTLSIDRYKENQPWMGYSQFCREFLAPLVLTSLRGIDFQPWMRGAFSGISMRDIGALLRKRDLLRKGVFFHIYLHAKLEGMISKSKSKFEKVSSIKQFPKVAIFRQVTGLKKMVGALNNPFQSSKWSSYESTHSYEEEDTVKKQQLVANFFENCKLQQVVDIGCNKGNYSLPFAKHVERIIALDADHLCINELYQRVKEQNLSNYYPFICNLLNPSPSLGWNLQERKDFKTRFASDGFLALALVHHICITGNIPIEQFVAMLSDFGKQGIVEWVDKEDSMTRMLLANRQDVFCDYTWDYFEQELSKKFTIEKVVATHGGSRKLCLVKAL